MPQPISLKALFDADPGRDKRFALRLGPLYADFSRQPVDAPGLEAWIKAARRRALPAAIQALFSGELVNATERRPALHWALRAADADLPDVALAGQRRAWRRRMGEIASALRAGEWQGASGAPVTDVVCLGIGGSELGPRLVVEALGAETTQPRLHFIANVDGHPVARLLERLHPARTVVLITSKNFTTAETLANARTLQRWLEAGMSKAAAVAVVQRHVLVVTAYPDRAAAFGIPEGNVLPLWEGVGGRFSLWSAAGLPIMLALGEAGFDQLLAGARLVDEHFRDAPLHENLPVLLGLLDYQRLRTGQSGLAVVPYDERLGLLPEYLQQLIMESLGKAVDVEGKPLSEYKPPIVFGAAGTRAQHAFFQALHQGNLNAAVDFIGVVHPDHTLAEHHQALLANLLAQATALAFGTEASVSAVNSPPSAERGFGMDAERSLSGQGWLVKIAHSLKRAAGGVPSFSQGKEERPPRAGALQPHRACPGNRPCNVVLLDALTPESLGALLALYEHRVYVTAVMARVNPFDQFGVELSKRLADETQSLLAGESTADASLGALIAEIKRVQDNR